MIIESRKKAIFCLVKFANWYKAKRVTFDNIKRNAVSNIIVSGKNIHGDNLELSHNLKPLNRQSGEKISKKSKLRSYTSKCKKDEKDGCGNSEENGNPKSLIEDEMPNTVLPNPNIYGGFPENDIWGNFELPPPSILRKLKLQLKAEPFYHKPNYGGNAFLVNNLKIIILYFGFFSLSKFGGNVLLF